MTEPAYGFVVNDTPRERVRNHLGQRYDGKVHSERSQVARAVDAERADTGPPQCSQVRADAERGAEVAGERSDVGAGRAGDLDVEVGSAPSGHAEHGDRHTPRRERGNLAGAGTRISTDPANLHRADARGHLVDR